MTVKEIREESIATKLSKYRKLTEKALSKVAAKNDLSTTENEMAQKLLQMANAYFSDAKYFESKSMHLTALAAYSYAHAWIDAGVRLGLLDGKGDDKLFVLP